MRKRKEDEIKERRVLTSENENKVLEKKRIVGSRKEGVGVGVFVMILNLLAQK